MDEPQTESATAPPRASGQGTIPPRPAAPFWTRRPVILVGAALLALLIFPGFEYLATTLTHETTDNAFLDGDIVSIAPKLAGNVTRVYVEENQPVKAGDPLVDIDARDYDAQLAQKKAQQEAAEANTKLIRASFDMLRSQVETAAAKARESDAEAAADKAEAEKAAADMKRAEDLFQKKITSQQEYDAAKAAADMAEATFKAGVQKASSDQSKVAEAKAQLEAGLQAMDRAQAQTHEANANVDKAQLDLSYTHIVAPEDGRVTRKAVQSGDYVEVGQRLMALVLTNIWVTANFKETQLRRIRVGQPVEVTVDSVAGRVFTGRVQSIQDGSGARFSLLPAENAVGNYVKVVQRVPVKIVFDHAVTADHVLGPGMSVVPSIKVADHDIPRLADWVAAVIVAAGVGAWWWRAASVKRSNL